MSNAGRIELHQTVATAGMTAVDQLAGKLPLSRQQIKQAMASGAVWLETPHGTRRLRRAGKALKTGQQLHCYYDPVVLAQQPDAASLVADEGDYSIWNKPAGMYCHGSKWGDHCTIYRWAETHLEPQRDAYLVHRLDRMTQGLVILAHNKKTAAAFGEMFQQRDIEKYYIATVEGELQLPSPTSITEAIDGRHAETRLLAADYDADTDETRVELQILTGRKHQVRIHLASLGHPVIGDRLHGSRNRISDLQLCAHRLAFTCPVSGDGRQYTIDC